MGFDNAYLMDEILESHGVEAAFPYAGNFGALHFYAEDPAVLYKKRVQIMSEATDQGIYCCIYFVPKWGNDWTLSKENSLPGKPGLE